MPTTTKGLRYPANTDAVTNGALAIEQLAEDVDAALGHKLTLTQQAVADILLKLVQIAGATGAVIDARDSANNVVFSVDKSGSVTAHGVSIGAVSTANAALFIQSVAGLVAYLVEYRDEANVSIFRVGGHGGLTSMPSQAAITAFVANNLLATTADVAKFQVNGVDYLAVDKAGHLCGRGPGPTVAAGAAMGTAPPAPVLNRGNDQAGRVTFGTGTVPSAGVLCTITYNRAYATSPLVVVQQDAGPNALDLYCSNAAAGAITVSCRNAPSASQAANTYGLVYQVTGA